MKKFLIKTSIAALLLLLAACGLDKVITHNLHRSDATLFCGYNDFYFGDLGCNAVIMGTSRGQVQFVPAVLDSLLPGYRFYNLGVNGRGIQSEIVKYHAYARRQGTPEIIIQNVDLWTMSDAFGYEREQYLPYLTVDDSLWHDAREMEGFPWAYRWLPLVRYAGYRQVIAEGLHLGNKLDRQHMEKGYVAHACDEWDGRALAELDTLRFTVDSDFYRLFDHYLVECKAQGIRLVLVLAPIYIGVTEKMENPEEMCRTFQTLAVRHGFPLLNYTYDTLSLDTSNFYNGMHLNHCGATRFSSRLAHDLQPLLLP